MCRTRSQQFTCCANTRPWIPPGCSTVADDLARWKAGLAGRPDVTIRVYDADNHLFFPGAGPSAPAEYEPAQHMDPAVVAGIASWLASAARAGR